MMHHMLGVSLLTMIVAGSGVVSASEDGERILRKEITIRASLDEVWTAWTTSEGLTPVSAKSNVELRVGGPYEWFLDLEPDENGLRGGQGSRVLAFLPGEVLAFEWTFPPAIPSLREAGATTQVVIQLDEPADGVVRVRFAQLGWAEGEDWDQGYSYFDKAWDWVLDRMKESLEEASNVTPNNS
ncbi:MAG TPA: SRPBCC domain-containing protein [Methylomirabilota bacterium]|nr:SRPBCC domain-containing protein [Methylomirabilota bacterium]